jgi:hypothetical protein
MEQLCKTCKWLRTTCGCNGLCEVNPQAVYKSPDDRCSLWEAKILNEVLENHKRCFVK